MELEYIQADSKSPEQVSLNMFENESWLYLSVPGKAQTSVESCRSNLIDFESICLWEWDKGFKAVPEPSKFSLFSWNLYILYSSPQELRPATTSPFFSCLFCLSEHIQTKHLICWLKALCGLCSEKIQNTKPPKREVTPLTGRWNEMKDTLLF